MPTATARYSPARSTPQPLMEQVLATSDNRQATLLLFVEQITSQEVAQLRRIEHQRRT